MTTSRLTDEQIETRAIQIGNARRFGMSSQALLVLAEELLSEVRAARAAPAAGSPDTRTDPERKP